MLGKTPLFFRLRIVLQITLGEINLRTLCVNRKLAGNTIFGGSGDFPYLVDFAGLGCGCFSARLLALIVPTSCSKRSVLGCSAAHSCSIACRQKLRCVFEIDYLEIRFYVRLFIRRRLNFCDISPEFHIF